MSQPFPVFVNGDVKILSAPRVATQNNQTAIIEQGTHAELMKSSPVYQEIYESQLGGGVRMEGEPL